MAEDRSDAAAYLGWFFLGAALGAAAALVMTPKTGRETRDILAEKSNDLAKKAQQIANEAQGRAGDWFDKSRELFEEQTQRLMSAFEAGKQAMREDMGKSSS